LGFVHIPFQYGSFLAWSSGRKITPDFYAPPPGSTSLRSSEGWGGPRCAGPAGPRGPRGTSLRSSEGWGRPFCAGPAGPRSPGGTSLCSWGAWVFWNSSFRKGGEADNFTNGTGAPGLPLSIGYPPAAWEHFATLVGGLGATFLRWSGGSPKSRGHFATLVGGLGILELDFRERW